MKRIVCILLSFFLLSTASFAQNMEAHKGEAHKAKQAPAAGKKDAPKLKKDGTPDMRHKANKDAAKPAPKLKKDGTPDMRYKQNKDAAKKK